MATVSIAPLKTDDVFPRTTVVHYPESDGKPMTETDKHRRIMTALIEALTAFFRNVSEVYVSGNLMMYYEEGNPAACIAPDVFVVRGISKKERRVYKMWEEGKAPEVVIELSSRSTRLDDLGVKRTLYAEFGVAEYFIFDPYQEYLKPPLQGYRLEQNTYMAIAPDAQGKLHSAILGLDLQIVNGDLRLGDPRTGKLLMTPLEAQTAADEAATARQAAEAEIERLRAELKKLQSQ